MDNPNSANEIENSYILREYFKGFKLNTNDVFKIREKFNKTDRNFILDSIVKQNAEIYNIIAENYSGTINKFEQISEQINQLNEQLTNVCNDNLVLFNLRTGEDVNISYNNSQNSSSTDGDMKEPTSIKQLNSNISDNFNKIQQYQNEIHAKNNIIENKLNQIKDDENFLNEVEQEKEIYIDNLSDDVLNELIAENGAGFTFPYLFKLTLILFEYVYLLPKERESNNQELLEEKNKARVFKEFKKEIFSKKIESLKKKLRECQKNEFFYCTSYVENNAESNVKSTSDKLREINQLLDSLKTEAEGFGKNKIYDKFFFPIFKTLKLVVFISLGKIRVDKLKDAVENERDDIYSLNNNIKELTHKNTVMERLKNEISRKYENRSGDASKVGDSLISSGGNNNQENRVSTANSNTNPQPNQKSKQKQAITKLKLLHNELEHNYVMLLKNISKKIIKPKDLMVRKHEPEYYSNKIK